MMNGLTRVRLIGGALALVIFALGVAVGLWYGDRDSGQLQIKVLADDRMPRELERLGLSAEQTASVRAALYRGRDRVIRVADDFRPQMRSAVDSTDQEIRAILSPVQRTSFDSARRANGPAFHERKIIEQR